MNTSPLHSVELEVFCCAQLRWPAAGRHGCAPNPLHAALPVVAHKVKCKIYLISSSETLLALLEEKEPVLFLICEIYD